MTDRDALLRSILERPDDDVRRLVMADWLEENGESERAEFIRVQLEIASTPLTVERRKLLSKYEWEDMRPEVQRGKSFVLNDPQSTSVGVLTYPDPNPALGPLRKREGELWSARAYGKAPEGFIATLVTDYFGRMDDHRLAVYRRGFVQEIHCTLADWVGGPCERCGGRGGWETGPHAEDCRHCNATGRTPAHGPRIVAEQPVERVWTEKRPQGSGNRWHWMREVDNAHPCSNGLPWVIFDLLSGFDLHEGSFKDYPTEFAAQSAISLALVNWARREAGLPPLPQETP